MIVLVAGALSTAQQIEEADDRARALRSLIRIIGIKSAER
ncbi:hypothetical protein THS5294_01538 [Thalassobacter stenotrophicus]|uniref:Uncharacterized protein n=1 Tax=Thalassobacter stenotrophicus TaxID=266809 RepID=A0A0P1EYR8_9RHOB|nr:hypothetical protein THS5294_01538 [Thalassobacter stenotrophicus]